MSMHDDVIDVYGAPRTTVDTIEQSPSCQALLAKYSAVPGFAQVRMNFKRQRLMLQKLLEGQTPQDAVKHCLKLIYRTAEDRNEIHMVIKRAYWHDWSQSQQQYYDDVYAVITGNVHYFLSFTNYNMTPGSVNIVNRNHRHLIADTFFNRKPEEIGDYDRENLIAKVVWYFLESKGMKGFYYPLHQGDNNVVQQKLLTNLKSAVTFVQVVHGAIFEKSPVANHCFFEYDNVCQAPQCRKRMYILAERRMGLQTAMLRYSEFDPWRSEVINLVDAFELEYSEFYDDRVLRSNSQQINDKIVRAVEKTWLELFDHVPP